MRADVDGIQCSFSRMLDEVRIDPEVGAAAHFRLCTEDGAVVRATDSRGAGDAPDNSAPRRRVVPALSPQAFMASAARGSMPAGPSSSSSDHDVASVSCPDVACTGLILYLICLRVWSNVCSPWRCRSMTQTLVLFGVKSI